MGVLHLPDAPEKMSSPFTSTALHNGETSLDSIHRTTVSISARQLKYLDIHTQKTKQSMAFKQALFRGSLLCLD